MLLSVDSFHPTQAAQAELVSEHFGLPAKWKIAASD